MLEFYFTNAWTFQSKKYAERFLIDRDQILLFLKLAYFWKKNWFFRKPVPTCSATKFSVSCHVVYEAGISNYDKSLKLWYPGCNPRMPRCRHLARAWHDSQCAGNRVNLGICLVPATNFKVNSFVTVHKKAPTCLFYKQEAFPKTLIMKTLWAELYETSKKIGRFEHIHLNLWSDTLIHLFLNMKKCFELFEFIELIHQLTECDSTVKLLWKYFWKLKSINERTLRLLFCVLLSKKYMIWKLYDHVTLDRNIQNHEWFMIKKKKNIRKLNNTQQLRPYRLLKPNLDKNCNFLKWAKFL